MSALRRCDRCAKQTVAAGIPVDWAVLKIDVSGAVGHNPGSAWELCGSCWRACRKFVVEPPVRIGSS